MPETDKLIEDFLRSLKVSLNHISVYFPEHPLFLSSIRELKAKFESVFNSCSPFIVAVAPHAILIADKTFSDNRIFVSLAEFFHQRRIKSIKFIPGIGEDELITFFSNLTIPPDKVSVGEVSRIYGQGLSHIIIEELQYSSFLSSSSGEPLKSDDFWRKFLHQASSSSDTNKFEYLENNFFKALGKLNSQQLIYDKEINQALGNIFEYAKGNRETYKKISKDFFKFLFQEKVSFSNEEFSQIMPFFASLDSNDLAEIFLKAISEVEGYDEAGFMLMGRLSTLKQDKEVVRTLGQKIEDLPFNNKETIKNKLLSIINKLTSSKRDSDAFLINNFFSHLLANLEFKEEVYFEHKSIEEKYLLLLINLLFLEEDDKHLKNIVACLQEEKEKILSKQRYIVMLAEALKEKVGNHSSLDTLKDEVFSFLEEKIIRGDISYQKYLPELKNTNYSADDYLNYIFKEKIINKNIIELFLRFFPQHRQNLEEEIKKVSSDTNFLLKIITALFDCSSPHKIEILKKVFYFANKFIKKEILERMREKGLVDEDFLLPLLKDREFFIKESALRVILTKTQLREKAARELFAIRSFLGLKDRLLCENIKLAKEVNLKEARGYIAPLAKIKSPFRRKLVYLARQTLEYLK